MKLRSGAHRISTSWWTVILLVAVAVFLFVTTTAFAGTFRSYVPVTLSSDRAGLVLETNAKVMLRGVQVGRVSQIGENNDRASLRLEIDPDQIRYIPANVQAQISATTAFGAKFVELVYQTFGQLRANGMTLLLVEQSMRRALSLADRVYLLKSGSMVLHGKATELAERNDLEHIYFGGVVTP